MMEYRNTLKQAVDAIQSMAAALYDGGWRAADSTDLMREYGFTADEVAYIVRELERMEIQESEDD